MAKNEITKQKVDNPNFLQSPTTKKDVAALPDGYEVWRKNIIALIEQAKYKTAFNVNAELLSLYWEIGNDIINKQKERGWGAQVIHNYRKIYLANSPMIVVILIVTYAI